MPSTLVLMLALLPSGAGGPYRGAFHARLNHYMIITRLRIDLHFGNRVAYRPAFDYHEGHLLTASNQDQSAPFRRFNSTPPLPQPPAPLRLSYLCKKQRKGQNLKGLNMKEMI